MKFASENRILAGFNFTSLTDVVLQLLIFFLLSSSFVVQPGIKVQVPRAMTGEQGNDRGVTITLTAKGRIYMNAEEVSLQVLGQRLPGALRSADEKLVVVRADRDVTLQNTIQVIDIAKSSGAAKFVIATEPLAAQ